MNPNINRLEANWATHNHPGPVAADVAHPGAERRHDGRTKFNPELRYLARITPGE